MPNPLSLKQRYLSFKKGICPYCGKKAELIVSDEKDTGTCICGAMNMFTDKNRRGWG